MKKISINSKEVLNLTLNKLTPSWQGVFTRDTIERGQVKKSASRNYMFGTIMNDKFIKLMKTRGQFKAGELVSISDIYDEESATNLTGLIIYRLGNSSKFKEPTIVEA